MTDAKYVLCRWEERSWPAKVLDGPKTSTNDKGEKETFLDVQILSLDEKIKVKSTEVETLKKSQIEKIASCLASQHEVPAAPLEELTYRRSLRVALDVLNEDSSWSRQSPARRSGSNECRREKQPTEAASSLRNSPSFFREDASAGSRPSTAEKDPEFKVDPKKGLGKARPQGPCPRLQLEPALGMAASGATARVTLLPRGEGGIWPRDRVGARRRHLPFVGHRVRSQAQARPRRPEPGRMIHAPELKDTTPVCHPAASRWSQLQRGLQSPLQRGRA